MVLSAPWDDSLQIIDLQPVKIYKGLTQWALVPLGMTLLRLLPCSLKTLFLGTNPTLLGKLRAESLENIKLQTVKNICYGLT